jgi:putative mannosyltransferase
MQDLRAAIDERLGNPPAFPEKRFAGRGIVICAGGQRYFTCAWILIWLLRHVHQTKLPVQVWHLGRQELSEAMQLLLEEQGVEIVNAETVLQRHPATIAGAWPLKPYAIANSRFREVIFLDADTVPLADPAVIFDFDLYREAGLLFWPDVIDLRQSNPLWTTLELEPRNCISFDSGVLAIDKARGWTLLDMTILLNEHWREAYKYLHGDKDTFLLAGILTGLPHGKIPHRPFMVDGDLIQRDPNGDPLVHHRNGSKWKLFGENRPPILPALAPYCQQAIAELRSRWNGVIFHPPERSERAREEEAMLIERRYFSYATGATVRRLELRPGGVIGDGRTDVEQHWAVVERDGTPMLQFYSGSRLVVALAPQADGSWCGEFLGDTGFDARLVAEEEWLNWPHANEERILRSAEAELTTLLDPSLFASGFDAETARDLQGALTLLNRLCDDVPEQLAAKLAAMTVSRDWRGALEAVAETLIRARAARLRCTPKDLVVPVEINPLHYTRVF